MVEWFFYFLSVVTQYRFLNGVFIIDVLKKEKKTTMSGGSCKFKVVREGFLRGRFSVFDFLGFSVVSVFSTFQMRLL